MVSDILVPHLEIQRHRLDNGLDVILQPDNSLPLIAVNIWYHVGSKNEHPKRTGLAHLFEHMLFQGSKNVPVNDHFRLIQQAGGSANGSTWFDRTNYHATLPSSHLDMAWWLESERMGFLLPALDQEKLENQRSVVMNERRQRIDNQPYGRAFERLYELLYPPDHPYHWPVIGYMKDIKAATLDDVSDFFQTFYAPNNAVLTLAGDIQPDLALGRVEDFFGSLPSGKAVPPISVPEVITQSPRRETMEDAVELGRLYLAASIPAFGDRGWYAADLLATALSAGKSSPLYRDLVYTRQIATDVSAFALPTELTGSFVIVATAKPGVEAETLTAAVEEHLATMIQTGPSDSDLDRARNKVTTDLTDQFQRLDDRADLLSMFTTFFDDPERIGHEAQTYADLTRDDLVELATRYLHPDARVTLNVVPKSVR
jgi:zinc protease